MSFEKIELCFRSGNSVPVDRAWVTREEFEGLQKEALEHIVVKHHRDTLMEAIAKAAFKAGIYNGEVPLDGPRCLMLLDDMATMISTAHEVFRKYEQGK